MKAAAANSAPPTTRPISAAHLIVLGVTGSVTIGTNTNSTLDSVMTASATTSVTSLSRELRCSRPKTSKPASRLTSEAVVSNATCGASPSVRSPGAANITRMTTAVVTAAAAPSAALRSMPT